MGFVTLVHKVSYFSGQGVKEKLSQIKEIAELTLFAVFWLRDDILGFLR